LILRQAAEKILKFRYIPLTFSVILKFSESPPKILENPQKSSNPKSYIFPKNPQKSPGVLNISPKSPKNSQKSSKDHKSPQKSSKILKTL
jgi:hypothetical protein